MLLFSLEFMEIKHHVVDKVSKMAVPFWLKLVVPLRSFDLETRTLRKIAIILT